MGAAALLRNQWDLLIFLTETIEFFSPFVSSALELQDFIEYSIQTDSLAVLIDFRILCSKCVSAIIRLSFLFQLFEIEYQLQRLLNMVQNSPHRHTPGSNINFFFSTVNPLRRSSRYVTVFPIFSLHSPNYFALGRLRHTSLRSGGRGYVINRINQGLPYDLTNTNPT